MKIVLFGILVFLLYLPGTFAQSLVNGDFTVFASPNCAPPNGYECSTFSSSCVINWFSTHGRPQVVKDDNSNNYRLSIYSSANSSQSVGRGAAAEYNFAKGREYRIKIYYRGGSATLNNQHKLKLFAANNLEESTASCGLGFSPVPNVGSKQLIGEYVTGGLIDPPGERFFTFTATQNFSQFWIYAEAVYKPGGAAEVSFGADIDDVVITPNLCTPDITYNTGVLPSGTLEFGHITAGSSAGIGGSGIVTNNPNANTTIAAGYDVTFSQETSLTANAGYTFTAYIRPCNFRIANSPTAAGTAPVAADLRIVSLPTGKKIRVYPNPTTTNRIGADVDLTLGDKITVRLLNSQGNIVRQHVPLKKGVGVQRIEINLENLPRGIYFLQLITESGVVTEKVEKL